MTTDSRTGRLDNISVSRIKPNPENPRLTFRQAELDELQESIRQFGIQVPIAVYRRGSEYILIDGERRWRCASKLNLKTIPALIQDEPTPLDNLLLMFNIHALREQWDYLTIALKLPAIVKLLTKENGRAPNEAELALKTGLARGKIRRCRLLTNLPKRFQDMLLEELKKPKSKHALSEDLFIEMEKALKTIERSMPDLMPDKDRARDILIKKYRTGIIDNIVDFRKVGKIARSQSIAADPSAARAAVKRLLNDASYSITAAWEASVSEAYAERDIVSRIEHLLSKLSGVKPAELDDDTREKLEELVSRAQAILEADE